VRIDPSAELPPPSWIEPMESEALLPLPAIASVPSACNVVLPPVRDTSAVGFACVPATWTVPVEPLAEFPPPACTEPIEFVAEFGPLPLTPAGALTEARFPATVAEADGAVATGPA